MTQAIRRERSRAHTERDLRAIARRLLTSEGREGVTLRAIARELGITAPALYRYCSSREDLLRQLCHDVCAELGTELRRSLDTVPHADVAGQLFTLFRALRQWALAHPQEFALVFASPQGACGPEAHNSLRASEDQFSTVFLGVTGRLLAEHPNIAAGTNAVPPALVAELTTYREVLLRSLAETGVRLSTDQLGLSTVHLMLQCWVRLYGHLALEVFGRFPFIVANAETLFESMIGELAQEIGLTESIS